MAFFLPAILAITLGIFALDGYAAIDIGAWLTGNMVVGTTMAGILSWVGSISLLVTNRELYRVLEGYGQLNPIRLLYPLEKRRYARLLENIESLKRKKREHLSKEEPVPASLRSARNKLELRLVEEFPSKSDFLLPTAFGNTMRAFETYPAVMYGIEGVDGWDRLLAVIPEDYRKLIDDAKSQVDFWLNLGFLSVLLFGINVYFIAMTRNLSAPLPFLMVVLVSVIAPQRARRSAAEWGSMVKSAFDLFLPDLRKKVEMKAVSSPEEERGHWVSFSEAIVYRLPKNMDKIKTKKQAEKHTFE